MPNERRMSILVKTLMCGISSWSIVRSERIKMEMYFAGSTMWDESVKWTAANWRIERERG